MPSSAAAQPWSQVITPREQRRQPWKNGGGTTTEIAAVRDGAGVLWRVSVADVTADGPFSAFPGMERVLAVIDGAGLRLSVDGAPPVTVAPAAPAFHFAGEAAVACTLVGGPVRAFNLMVDRARLVGDVRRITPAQPVTTGAAATVLVLALGGEVLVRAGGSRRRLPAGHALRIDGADAVTAEGDTMLAAVVTL